MNRLRVGLVGGGPWAELVHGPGLVAHPRTELTGVWTRRPEAAAALAATLGSRPFAELDELIGAVDVVALAVPPHVQGELAARAAAAGRHLICEKPLAGTVEAAREVVAAVQAAGVQSSMLLTLHHDPVLRAWLADLPPGPAGAETAATARWLSGALLNGPFAGSGWRIEHGALLDLGPHVIDLLETAIGPVDAVEWAHRGEPDLWQFGLRHTGGASSSAMLSLRMPLDPAEIEFGVFGKGVRSTVSRSADATAAFAGLLDELVAAIDGTGPPPALDVARGLRLQELIEQVAAAVR